MLEYPLSIIEFLIYVVSLTLILVGLFRRRGYIISWSFVLLLVNTLFYAKAYTISNYVSSMLLTLGSISMVAITSANIIIYMLDHGIVKKY